MKHPIYGLYTATRSAYAARPGERLVLPSGTATVVVTQNKHGVTQAVRECDDMLCQLDRMQLYAVAGVSAEGAAWAMDLRYDHSDYLETVCTLMGRNRDGVADRRDDTCPKCGAQMTPIVSPIHDSTARVCIHCGAMEGNT